MLPDAGVSYRSQNNDRVAAEKLLEDAVKKNPRRGDEACPGKLPRHSVTAAAGNGTQQPRGDA